MTDLASQAKANLQLYCGKVKLVSHQLVCHISDDERKTINDKCDKTIKWLEADQTAEQDEYAAKQKEIEGVCRPILLKLEVG